MTTKTIISFKHKTPEWATWMFRITFILTSIIAAYVGWSNMFTLEIKYEVAIASKALDFGMWLFSRMFGVKEIENYINIKKEGTNEFSTKDNVDGE